MHDNSISSTATLPDDVTILQRMVGEFSERVSELSNKLSERDSVIERLKHELLLLRQWRFGRKSEKLEAGGQLSLFPTDAVAEYQKRGVIVYDRNDANYYSVRCLHPFGLDGVIRVSPLHCHNTNDVQTFLRASEEIAAL